MAAVRNAVVADPGLSKSRLLFEFKTKNQSTWMVLEALLVLHGKTSAYLTVIELLYSYFDVKRDDDARKKREKTAAKVLSLDPSLEDTLTYRVWRPWGAILLRLLKRRAVFAIPSRSRAARTLGVARNCQPGAVVARYESLRGCAHNAGRHLRLVHRGLRHHRPEGCERAPRRIELHPKIAGAEPLTLAPSIAASSVKPEKK